MIEVFVKCIFLFLDIDLELAGWKTGEELGIPIISHSCFSFRFRLKNQKDDSRTDGPLCALSYIVFSPVSKQSKLAKYFKYASHPFRNNVMT